MTNIPEEDRPVILLKVNLKRHRKDIRKLTEWIRKQADYIQKNHHEMSDNFTARLLCDKPARPLP